MHVVRTLARCMPGRPGRARPPATTHHQRLLFHAAMQLAGACVDACRGLASIDRDMRVLYHLTYTYMR
jgi:hypothetical protein